MLLGQNNDIILWDGSTYNNSMSYWGLHQVGVVGGGEWTELLNYTSGATINITNHYFNLDTISYLNANMYPYIRHTVYDVYGNIYSRPRFDVMTNSNTTIKTNILGYADGIYRSEVYGWTPYGSNSDTTTITFINYICGDINNDGSAADIDDLNYFVDYSFYNGAPPPHLASADVNCKDGVDIDDLVYLVDYVFRSGPAPACCHSLP